MESAKSTSSISSRRSSRSSLSERKPKKLESLSDQIFNFFTGRPLSLNALAANLESVLPADGGLLAPESVPVVARRIDLLTALTVRCPNSLSYSEAAGHEASLLHYAVRDGNKEIIRFLLEHKRDVDLTKTRDAKYGGTPLHWATSPETVEMLIDADCEQDTVSEATGDTPLQIAIKYERYDVAVAFIELGSDLNVQSRDGPVFTVLHQAVEKPDWHLVGILLAYGADANVKNGEGDSPRHVVATRIALNGSRRREETRIFGKILSLLHFVGATRCPLNKNGCAPGCSAAGSFNGEPVDGYTSDDLVASLNPAVSEILALFDANCSDCQFSTGTKVLCLDGGAMYGILTVMILKHLEAISNKQIKHCFNIICGTGIGGVIALYLAYLEKKSLVQAQKLFYFLRRKVLVGSPMYTAAVIEGHFKRTFGAETILQGQETPFVPKLIIPCYHTDRMVRNYNLPSDQQYLGDEDDDAFLVFRAASDTGVVDELFRAGSVQSQNCQANPSVDALTELSELSMRDAALPKKSLFVSVGTTIVPLIDTTAISNFDSGTGVVEGEEATPEDEDTLDIVTMTIDGDCHLQQPKVADPRRAVDQARAWCRDSNCTFARLAPMIGTNLSVDTLQFEDETSDTVTRAMFELRTWISRNSSVIAKVASTII